MEDGTLLGRMRVRLQVEGEPKVGVGSRGYGAVALMLIMLAGLLPVSTAQAATYLELLKQELEAGGGEVDKGGLEGAPLPGSDERDHAAISAESFADDLKRNHRSTFTLYTKLRPEQQTRVLEEFRRTGNYEKVTRLVLRLLYGI